MPPVPGTPRLLRAINDRAALDLLLARGPLSRTEIGALTGLSKPTASQLLARLSAAGLVRHVGHREGGRGPNALLYQINPAAAHVAGLDVTPARIRAAVADITGAVVAEHELPTPGRSAAGVPHRVRAAVEGATSRVGLEARDLAHAVIGIQGAINPETGRLGYARHIPGWHRPGVVEEVRSALGTTVDIENDVNLAAVAEQNTGPSDFVLLWAGDGIGLAIVLAGRLHRGATGGAGEVGYMPMPGLPVPRDVARGTTGGFQSAAGGPAVRALARSHGLAARTPAAAVAKAVGAGEAGRPMLAELARRLATGLATITAVLDPPLVVLAGDVGRAGGEPLRALVQNELRQLAIPRPRVAQSAVAGNPVLRGAVDAALIRARDLTFGSTVEAG